MPWLDTRTILLLMAFTAVPTALVLVYVSGFYATRVRGVGHWTGANIALATGLLLLGLSHGSNDLAARVGGNTLLVLTTALYYLAIQRLLGDAPSNRLATTVVGSAGVIFLFLWLAGAPYHLAVIAISFFIALLTGLCAARLLRSPQARESVSQRITGRLFLLGCLLMSVRLGYSLFTDTAPAGLYSPNNWHSLILGSAHVLTMLMSLGFALMIVDQLASKLNRLATLDPLTGIGNRRVFYTRAESEIARQRRKGTPLSILMIDLDRFKSINDTHGHAAGDKILRRFTSLTRPQLREYDFFARLGGEEFAVLLPDTPEAVALAIAERLRVQAASALLPDSEDGKPATVSIGVAQLDTEDTNIDQLIQRADLALYAAKRGGRNRVRAASQLTDGELGAHSR